MSSQISTTQKANLGAIDGKKGLCLASLSENIPLSDLVDSRRNIFWTDEVSATSASAVINSGAISIPGPSVITNLGVIVSTALSYDSAHLGTRFGTSAAGIEYTGPATGPGSASLATTATSLAVGKGNCQDAVLNAHLDGRVAIASGSTGVGYLGTTADIYGAVTGSAGAFISGGVKFLVEYILVT